MLNIKRRVGAGHCRVMMTSLRAKVHGKFTRNTRRNIRNSKTKIINESLQKIKIF
jgi:hypothetical protein